MRRLFVLIALPVSALASDPCGSCAGRPLEPVHLHLVSADQNDVWYFIASGNAERDQLHKSHCPQCKLVQYSMKNTSGIEAALKQVAAHCQQIQLLTVVSHGAHGGIEIGPDKERMNPFGSSSLNTLSSDLSCAIAPGALLYFDGCNIARGCRGESFLTMLAGKLLSKGGSVRACYVTGDGATGFVGQPTFCSQSHTLSVDRGLKNPRWRGGPPPKTGSECRQQLASDLATLERLIYAKGDCNYIDSATYAAGRLKECMQLEEQLGENRTQFTELEATEAIKLEQTYEMVDEELDRLQQAKTCARPKTDCATCDATSGPTLGEKIRANEIIRTLWDLF